MFGKKAKSLEDFIPIDEYEPYNDIETMEIPEYPEGIASVEHKELEKDVADYWDLVHPMVCDLINSYAKTINKMAEQVKLATESTNTARRNLTIEQQNVQELNDTLREIKKQLSEEATMRRDLEERLRDERDILQAHFEQEKRSLELIVESKFGSDVDVEEVIKKISENMGSSEEVERLENKVERLEKQLADTREENERVQTELAESFMQKIMKSDEIIQNLKERLGEE